VGEYAEMMLDGTCCASCGEYLHGAGIDGVPSYCGGCRQIQDRVDARHAAGKAHECPIARKRHMADKHKMRFGEGGKVVPLG
jgi:hypothetical protein